MRVLTTPPTWPRRINVRAIFVHDLPLKLTAVLIAIVFAIVNAQNAVPREIVAAFDGRVPVERPEVPSGFVLRGNLGDVAVTVRGPEGTADHLSLSDFHATLDLTGVDAGQGPRDAKVIVTVSDQAVKVVDVTPPTVSVRLERITSRTLAVQTHLANDPPKGLQPGPTSVSPNEVRVVGPESAVAQIAAVFATVRFGDVTTDLTQSAPAIPVDASGLAIDGLQVEPGIVVVTVPVLPIATTRTVPILWSLTGAVARGYWISNVSTDPVAVTVSGDQAVIASLARIDTATLDVSGLTATRAFIAPLLLPEGVSLLKPVDATVTVTVVPLSGTRPFFAGVQVQNLAPNTTADLDVPTVIVTIAGPAPTLAGLSNDQVTATVDAANRGAGTYVVDVAVKIPPGTSVQSVQPTRVTLTIKAKQ